MPKSPSASDKIRILIADDHSLMRVGIRSMLEMQPDMSVVGEADDGQSAIDLALRLKPDVVVMDLMMPVVSGADATKSIRDANAQIKIIILSPYGSTIDMAKALDNGADGALMKESRSSELIGAIRDVVSGKTAITPEIACMRENVFRSLQFTEKQLVVLKLLVQGMTDKEIGNALDISRAGVQKHTAAIFAKLGATNRAEATRIAYETHLMPPLQPVQGRR